MKHNTGVMLSLFTSTVCIRCEYLVVVFLLYKYFSFYFFISFSIFYTINKGINKGVLFYSINHNFNTIKNIK